MSNDDLSTLRNDIARARRAATRKVSRLKTRHGVSVSGTEFDPRRPPQAARKYTRKQLESYKRELDKFLSRSTQYVPDSRARPIPRKEWDRYKTVETKYRDMAGTIYDKVKDVQLPSGETISERLAKMDVLHKSMHNPVVNKFYEPKDRQSGDVTSRNALRKLERDLRRKSTPRSQKAMVREAKAQLAKMLDVVNSRDVANQVNTLSTGQFIALWNYTNFASAIAMSYDSAKKMLTPREESWGHEKIRQQTNDALELIEWVKGHEI